MIDCNIAGSRRARFARTSGVSSFPQPGLWLQRDAVLPPPDLELPKALIAPRRLIELAPCAAARSGSTMRRRLSAKLNFIGKNTEAMTMPSPEPRWPLFKQVLRQQLLMDCMMQ